MSAIAAKVSSGLMKLATAAPAKRTPKTANNHFSRGYRHQPELLQAGEREQDPDQDADCVDRGLVELEDYHGGDGPQDPDHQPQPPHP